MLIEELIENVNLEDDAVEFKGIIKEGENPKKGDKRLEYGWLKEIAGFANSKGGSIYIGVDNKSHEILSLDHETADKVALMVQRLVKEHIEPPINYTIIKHPLIGDKPTRYVLEVKVEKAKYPPISLKIDGAGFIFVRHFGKTSIATGEEIRDLVLNSDSVSFDDRFTDTIYNPEDFSKMRRYYAEHHEGKEVSERELMSIGFISSERKLSEGALLFKDDCSSVRTLVVCSQFLGLNKGTNTFYASKSMQGNLLDECFFIKDFITNRSADGFVKESDGRRPLISYPARSLMEAIVNALAHRNYFIHGRQIEVNMYRDRLEIISPGALLGSRYLKEERNLSSIPPMRRNEVICGVFSLLNLMEKRGSGFDKIEQDYRDYGPSYAPCASSDGDSFLLTLPDLSHEGGIISKMECPSVHTRVALEGKYDSMILSYCYNEKKDAASIAAYLGLAPSSYFRSSILDPLVESGYLYIVKTGRTSYYKTNPEKVLVD